MSKEDQRSELYDRLKMKKAVNIGALAGIFAIIVRLTAGLAVSRFFPGLYGSTAFLFAVTCCTMMPPVVIYRLEFGKIKTLAVSAKEKRKRLGASCLSVLTGFGFCSAWNFLISMAYRLAGDSDSGTSANMLFTDVNELLFAIIAVVIAPAVCEEILFRGCVSGSLQPYGNSIAVLISALIFGMLHSGIKGAVFAFVSGIVLGLVRVYTGRLSAAVVVHLLNNLLAILTSAAGVFISAKAQSLVFYLSGGAACVLSAAGMTLIKAKKISAESESLLCGMSFSGKLKLIAGECPLLWIYLVLAAALMFL